MKRILLFAIVAFSLSSCYYDSREELYPENPNECKTTGLTYIADTEAIFANSCAISGCHESGGQTPTLETYVQVTASIDRIEQRALVEKSMPPAGPLGSCDQSQLTQWIADGYPEK